MTTALAEPVISADIIQTLLDGERVCPDCLKNKQRQRLSRQLASWLAKLGFRPAPAAELELDSCLHRQAQLEAVLDAYYVTIYVPWWLTSAYWPEDESIVCSACGELIDECAICGLECSCPANAPAHCAAEDEGPFCCLCVPDDCGYSVDDLLTLALGGRVVTHYRRYEPHWFQPTLPFSA